MRGGSWQPIETAPKDGSLILLWCVFGDADEPAVAHWANNVIQDGPFGPMSWRELDGGGIAELVPTHWKHIGKPRNRGAR